MTAGLGLRWALTGPIMTNVLAGGGDFRHFLDHLGPALQACSEDMHAHEFKFEPESIDGLDTSVQEWVSKVDLEALEKKRNEFIIGLIKDKTDASIE